MIAMPQYEDRFAIDPINDYMTEYRNIQSDFNYRRMLGMKDFPHLQTNTKRIERENLVKKYGANSAIVRSMNEGLFQRSEDFNLIYTDDDLNSMKAAMRGDNKGKTIGTDVEAAGDISGGGDEQILMLRIGTSVEMQDYNQCKIDLDQADYWVAKLKTLGLHPWQLTVDGGGLGATVANYMEQRLMFSGIKRAMANVGPKFKFEFRDKYTEVHFFIKELLSAGVLHLSRYDKVLLKQMRSRRFIEMESGEKLKTEPKPSHRKREHSSPDRLDTLVYLFYDFDPYLLSNFCEIAKAAVDSNAPTKFELDASRKSSIGGRTFKGAQNMSDMRRTIASDRKIYNMSLGRGR